MLFLVTACNNVPSVGAGPNEGAAPAAPVAEDTVPEAPTTTVAPPTTAPVEPAPADPGKVPEVDPKLAAPKDDVPKAPPVGMTPGGDLKPEAPAPAPKPAAPAPPAPTTTAAPPPPPANNGFSPIDIKLQTGQGNRLTQSFAPGLLACETMLENILIRDDNAGGTEHIVNLDVGELGGNAAGVAETPPPRFYDQARVQGLALTLDDDLPNQYSVCAVFVHELMHTLGVQHTGAGILSPVLAPGRMFIDRPIAVELNKIGYRFVGTVQQRIEQGQNIPLEQLVDSHSGTTAQALQAQAT